MNRGETDEKRCDERVVSAIFIVSFVNSASFTGASFKTLDVIGEAVSSFIPTTVVLDVFLPACLVPFTFAAVFLVC